jgi:hypothetical protein
MTNYLDRWYQDLITRTPSQLNQRLEAWGECERHTGPAYWYAKVKIAVAPSDQLIVVNQLDERKALRLKEEGWDEYAIFGVLDVMLTHSLSPYRLFQLTLLDADFNDIESRSIAFRWAGRDAARKILSQQ